MMLLSFDETLSKKSFSVVLNSEKLSLGGISNGNYNKIGGTILWFSEFANKNNCF